MKGNEIKPRIIAVVVLLIVLILGFLDSMGNVDPVIYQGVQDEGESVPKKSQKATDELLFVDVSKHAGILSTHQGI